ncbi:hypothetical protein L083_0900 [Actinoplanes sp. N902-109]|nr:hypothetical protein L083_0900 [Actinoplanes sp. N902-109]
MPEALAGLLWIHNQPPFGATLRRNPRARQPLPNELENKFNLVDNAH